MSEETILFVESPIGAIELRETNGRLTALNFREKITKSSPHPGAVLDACARQLEEYFGGERRVFDLPLDLTGTPFQREVWRALQAVPFGRTASYGEIARRIGRPAAVRAVGAANGRNPVSIIVPCHRIVGADGGLTGYGGGLWRKEWLLRQERNNTDADGGLFPDR